MKSPLQSLELLLCRAVVNNNPSWKWAARIEYLGRRARSRINSSSFDDGLLAITDISKLDRLRMRLEYNRLLTRFFYNSLITITANTLLINCYFDRPELARDYCAFVFSFRYQCRVLALDLQSLWAVVLDEGRYRKAGAMLDQVALRLMRSELALRDGGIG